MKIINPADGSRIGEIAVDDVDSIQRKVALLKNSREGNYAVDFVQKRLPELKKAIEKFSSYLFENLPDLAKQQSLETGKPITQAKNEISAVRSRIDFFLKNIDSVLKPEEVRKPGLENGNTGEQICQEPLGMIANISAWNYPYFVGLNVIIPALLTGNKVLYKPSEFALLTGQNIVAGLHKCGVLEEELQLVIGDGKVGQLLCEHKDIHGIFFTGSYNTGVKINIACAPFLKKVQLELGGKDPVYVCDDVDIDKVAASIADGAFYNNGQSCCAVERIYVHEKIYTAFLNHFVNEVKSFQMGDPNDEKTYLGPLTRSAQLDVLDSQVKDAMDKGAKLLCGGHKIEGKGNFFAATVLSSVDHSMLVMQEETFGPLIGIMQVKGDEEAVSWMKDSPYGLTAAVYSKNLERAREILQQIDCGSAYINCCDRVSPFLPWSGRRNSGLGLTLSIEGIKTFLQPKAFHIR